MRSRGSSPWKTVSTASASIMSYSSKWPPPRSPPQCSAAAPANRQRTVQRLDRWRALRDYRHAPNTGPRKSWAAGDATSRGVRLALMAHAGRDGLPLGALGQELGLLRRLLQRQTFHTRPAARLLRDGKRAFQNLLPRRVSRPDRGGVRDPASSAGQRIGSTRSSESSSPPRNPRSASSTRPDR